MKKKFLSLVLVMIMCLSVFTGCSLVTRNDAKYYNATVATINYVDGDKDVITKQELVTAYNSYGYNYVENYGYTLSKAIETTLDTIIDKKITIKAVENYYATLENGDENKDVVLNANETTYLWDETFDAVYSNMKTYFYEVVGEEDAEYSTDSNPNASVFVDYTAEACVDLENGVIRKVTPATTIRETYKAREENGVAVDYEYIDDDGVQVFKESMYEKIMALASDPTDTERDKQYKGAVSKYLKAIKNAYSYKTFSTDKDWWLFELDRVYNIMKDNYMVEKYEVIYNLQKHQGADVSNVSIEDVLKLYSAKVSADYRTYTGLNGQSTFENDIISDIANVDYVLKASDLAEGIASNFFSVAYIKVEFDESAKADYERYKADKEAGRYSRLEDYNNDINDLYEERLYVNVRNAETGEKTDDKVYVYDTNGTGLLSKIRNEINKFAYGSDEVANKQTEKDRAEAFRKYLYLYNDDDTLKGADYNTVFGISTTGEVLANDTFSSNEDVKTAIKSLYNNGNARVGDTTDIIRTEDGAYIFFYAGNIENLFEVTSNFDLTTNKDNIVKLMTTQLNIFSSKTIFDSLYETLVTDNFSVFQNMDMNRLRQDLVKGSPEIIKNNIKTL